MPVDTKPMRTDLPRVLILGGAGRLGTMMRAAWQAAPETLGITPIWQTRREAGLGGPVFDILAAPGAVARACAQADVVLLLAGVIDGSADDLAVNAALAKTVRKHAQMAGLPVIAVSSAAVYGRPSGPLREDTPCAPLTDYGRSKCAMEATLAGMKHACALRIGNVAGADALLGVPAPEGGRKLHVFADGRAPERSYIGPGALANAVARLARLAVEAPARLPEKLNLALPGVVGMDDLLSAAGEDWRPVPTLDATLPKVELDVSHAVELGLVPEVRVDAAAIVADMRRVRQRMA
ncbi:MAG: NAD-dependent epimerase/dehydratase family protein [Rhodobacteraceae bacterium]|nr:NAD-dependent epimerase/dehydratase family protein [Paracoccaceae bacterium]